MDKVLKNIKKAIRYTAQKMLKRSLFLKVFLTKEERQFFQLLNPNNLLSNNKNSNYLSETGWWQSLKTSQNIDKNLAPIPWTTYPFTFFIKERLTSNMRVFEYGSGNSSLFFAQKVHQVISVEHDKTWFEKIKKQAPENVNLIFTALDYDGNYCRTIHNFKNLHLVFIDGRDRVNCCKNAIVNLAENGVVILDDSHREKYKAGIDFIINSGFKKIDFWGLQPNGFHNSCTTIFYKENNCLDI